MQHHVQSLGAQYAHSKSSQITGLYLSLKASNAIHRKEKQRVRYGPHNTEIKKKKTTKRHVRKIDPSSSKAGGGTHLKANKRHLKK